MYSLKNVSTSSMNELASPINAMMLRIPIVMSMMGRIVSMVASFVKGDCFARKFSGHTPMCKTHADNKRMLVFVRKTRCNLIERCECTKTYSKKHFCMSYKTEKAPHRGA